MTTFYLVCAGLVLLSALFFLFPRKRDNTGQKEAAQANVEWLRLREQELAGQDEALREEARLRLLEDGALVAEESAAQLTASQGRFSAWVLLPLVALMSAAIYYALGAAPDVAISRQLDSMGSDSTEQEMDQLAGAIQSRLKQRPDNLQYQALLGRYYMTRQDYASASESYGALAQAAPGDADALAYAAQAEYLAAGRVLSQTARLRAEQAVGANPHQRTALGLLGMASYEQGDYRAAINYWERLLAVETPGSDGAAMIRDVISRARQQLGEEIASDTGADAQHDTTGAGGSVGVTVSVDLPASAPRNPGDTVFILARKANSNSRMPVAVQRLTVAQMPVTLRLDDSNSMAGQTFSPEQPVIVAVQVSPGGQPGMANASWAGEVGPLAPGVGTEAVTVELQAISP